MFGEAKPRIVEVDGTAIEAELGPHMLFLTNEDKPGFIGALGTVLGEAGLNVATFNLGRSNPGEEAIALIAIDEPISAETLEKVASLPFVKQAKALSF